MDTSLTATQLLLTGTILGLTSLLLRSIRTPRVERRTFPTPRRALIRIHRDLLAVEKLVIRDSGNNKPSEFERLVLILEDRRFFEHDGVDWLASLREAFKAITFRKHGGASTIDMQFVRTATGYKELRLRRKLYEMLLARIIQHRYSKYCILRSYLEHAFFGSGCIGCEAASWRQYDRAVSDLSMEEKAELAAMLVYPRPRNPTERWSSKIRDRAKYGLGRISRLEKPLKKLPRGE